MNKEILITLDSANGDVFKAANCPFLKSLYWDIGYSHADFTLPAHTAIFAGKLPHTFKGRFDWSARSNRQMEGMPQYKLSNPESPSNARIQLHGKNIIDAFNKIGYQTIGTGAVNWFSPKMPAHIREIDDFNEYKWFGEFIVAKQQIEWLIQMIMKCEQSDQSYFVFCNMGEVHHPFRIYESDPRTEYFHGFNKCFNAQKRCLEYLDQKIKKLIDRIDTKNLNLLVMGDHGENFGIDGLYGHSFCHPTVMQVPIIQGSF